MEERSLKQGFLMSNRFLGIANKPPNKQKELFMMLLDGYYHHLWYSLAIAIR